MTQSVTDERGDSGVDMYVAVDGSVVHLSIFNDDQVSRNTSEWEMIMNILSMLRTPPTYY